MHALFEVECVHFWVGCVHFLGGVMLIFDEKSTFRGCAEGLVFDAEYPIILTRCAHFRVVLYLFSRVVCLFYGVYFHSNSEEKVERRFGDG